jgi:DNA-binding XRE family transcriptional regulator
MGTVKGEPHMVKKRYPECVREDRGCESCSLSSYGRDCRNNPVNKLAYLRNMAGLTQQALADKAGIHIRQVQKLEYERDVANVHFRIGIALADALGVDPHELLR